MMIELDLSSYTLVLSNFQELKTSSIRTIDKCLKNNYLLKVERMKYDLLNDVGLAVVR